MKVQCSCGAKYDFEISPEMGSHPVRFICLECGLDASEFVDGLIRQELGQSVTPHGRVITVEARREFPIASATRIAARESDQPASETGVSGMEPAPLPHAP